MLMLRRLTLDYPFRNRSTMLKKLKHETKILSYLVGMGLSKNQSRRIIKRLSIVPEMTIGTIKLALSGDRFLVVDDADGMTSGIDFETGQLI